MVENGGLPQAAAPPPHRRRFKLDSPASDVAWPRAAALTAAGMVLALMLAVTVPGTRLSGVVGTATKYLTTTSLPLVSPTSTPIQLAEPSNNSSSAEHDGSGISGSESIEEADGSKTSSSNDSGGSGAQPESEGGSGNALPESEETSGDVGGGSGAGPESEGGSGDADPEAEESSSDAEPEAEESSGGVKPEAEGSGGDNGGGSSAEPGSEGSSSDAEPEGEESSSGAEPEAEGSSSSEGHDSGAEAEGEQGSDGSADAGTSDAAAEDGGGDEEAHGSSGDGGEDEPDLPCRESGYCSVGRLQAYVGEVDSTEGLKAALEACSYKKDFFLLTIGSGGHLLGMNFVVGAWKLGLANVMLHATSNESCAKLAAAGYHNVTCVWSDREWFPNRDGKFNVGESTGIWAVRYILMARAVWLGYNVWLLDTDSYLYRDPYKYLKVPPLSNVTFMSMADNGNIINGGTSYIQNAAPGGPAAWTIAHMCERMIRFVLSDIIAGNRLRHPYVRFTLWNAPDLAPDLDERLHYHDPGLHLRYPPDWADLTQTTEAAHEGGFNLTISHLNGKWDKTIGGKRFPPRGNHSLAFIMLLEEESGLKYADIEGPTPKNWVPPPNETFMFTPQWLISVWLDRGVRGTWDLQPPPQVMLHMVFMPGWVAGHLQKEYGMKSINAFNFEVAQALQGQLFPSATAEQPLPRVLALLPRDKLTSTTIIEYRDKLVQLVRLAIRVGRVMLLPDPVCNSTWLRSGDGVEDVQGHRRNEYDLEQVLPYGLDDDQHCVWLSAEDQGCMPSAYILHPDYLELVRRLPDGTGEPGPDNTVQLGDNQQQGQGQGQASSWEAVAAAAKQKEEPHILFLGAIPDLTPGSMPPEEGEEDTWWTGWLLRHRRNTTADWRGWGEGAKR
ncbi:hypothetical protein CHLNCDRAFT_143657 [Chlorella variabilis]|uniref:Nucleotide-diphospho-sugar transferase domain-containing protein n=1 Tax=Chlorella variabilis TaxID=554065 RepID=E1ZA68_CHLVA|nr:hypothetical protein CHLNCDRAFT_143657 [Chlorella variabilis]EFN57003.1 hypothetical protein CHLNCDRAFT_143657 [Chlorella variabilis]|eukprot:XP_005849105.1 hypothetical protein CHLNCDRAFT_143657 [Chlorella variabilis]